MKRLNATDLAYPWKELGMGFTLGAPTKIGVIHIQLDHMIITLTLKSLKRVIECQ